VAYPAGSVVVSGGTTYLAIASTTGNAPPNTTYWVATSGATSGGSNAMTIQVTGNVFVNNSANYFYGLTTTVAPNSNTTGFTSTTGGIKVTNAGTYLVTVYIGPTSDGPMTYSINGNYVAGGFFLTNASASSTFQTAVSLNAGDTLGVQGFNPGAITPGAGNTALSLTLTNLSGPMGATGTQGATGPAGGATGATGAAGSTGATGATGSTGATGTIGTVSNWASGTTYSAGQVVYCQAAGACVTAGQGSSYVSLISSNTGHDPHTTNGTDWAQITAAGADGSNGATGSVGATGATGATGGTNSFTFVSSYTNQASNTPNYLPPNGGLGGALTFPQLTYNAAPSACTVKSLTVYGDVVSGAEAEILTATVFKNDSATSMTCALSTTTTPGAVSPCSDSTHTFSVSAGDRLTIRMVENVNDGSDYNTVGYSTVLVCQ
jgi:hypothetical protein